MELSGHYSIFHDDFVLMAELLAQNYCDVFTGANSGRNSRCHCNDDTKLGRISRCHCYDDINLGGKNLRCFHEVVLGTYRYSLMDTPSKYFIQKMYLNKLSWECHTRNLSWVGQIKIFVQNEIDFQNISWSQKLGSNFKHKKNKLQRNMASTYFFWS